MTFCFEKFIFHGVKVNFMTLWCVHLNQGILEYSVLYIGPLKRMEGLRASMCISTSMNAELGHHCISKYVPRPLLSHEEGSCDSIIFYTKYVGQKLTSFLGVNV